MDPEKFHVVRGRMGSGLCPGEGLSFGAHGPHGFLKLPGREVEEGLHFRGEVGVVLEAETLRNHLKGKAFRDKAACQKHPVTPEKFLRAKPGNPLDRVLELAVRQAEGLGNSRHAESFRFRQGEEIAPHGADKMLTIALKFKGFFVVVHGMCWGKMGELLKSSLFLGLLSSL